VKIPDQSGLWVLSLTVENKAGAVFHRNFITFLTDKESAPEANRSVRVTRLEDQVLIRFKPSSFSAAIWSQRNWEVLDGQKVNGAGHGFYEFRIPWPNEVESAKITGGTLIFEASAKELFAKDRKEEKEVQGDYMRGKGAHDPGLNPNAYPMTDERKHPSSVVVSVNGELHSPVPLADDPADHRGILSWYSQKKDGVLREAGSYGYLVKTALSLATLKRAAASGEVLIRLEVPEGDPGGLALYGKRFGRYPLDPTLVLQMR
jgi:hypothetical protein